MKNLVLVLALSVLPLFIGARHASAVQGTPPVRPAAGVNRNDCFKDYLNHLKQCREEFCPNRITDCNETALNACIDGAKQVLEDCLKG